MTKLLSASSNGDSAQETSDCHRLTPQEGKERTLKNKSFRGWRSTTSQSFSSGDKSKVDCNMCVLTCSDLVGDKIDVYRKCVHNVKKCRHCIIHKIQSENGLIHNFLVEHHSADGRFLSATIGREGIRIRNNPEVDTTSDATHPIVHPDLVELHNPPEFDTTPRDTQHLESTMGSELTEIRAQLQRNFPNSVVRKSFKLLEQLTLLCIGLQFDSDLRAIVMRCVSFLSAIFDDGIILKIKDLLFDHVDRIEIPESLRGRTIDEIFNLENHSVQPQGIAQEAAAVWETLRQGIFTENLSFILGTAFAVTTCKMENIEFDHPFYKALMAHCGAKKLDGMDLIDHSIKLYNWVSTVGMACIRERSFAPLTVNASTLNKCQERLYYWQKRFSDMKRENVADADERQLMFIEVETIVKTLHRFVYSRKDMALKTMVTALQQQALNLYNDVRDFVHTTDAVKAAIGFHLHGVPKTGKSTIATQIHEQVCLARGVPYRVSDNAQLNLQSEFQDELSNTTQTITINETLPVRVERMSNVATPYTVALSLVDTVPYHPNRSNLEDKARITCQHISVVSTGNKERPFVNVAESNGAWERRYISVHMRMKPQYADSFGRFDPDKADGSQNYHYFDVYEIVFNGEHFSKEYFPCVNGDSRDLDTRQFLELVGFLARTHFKQQDNLDRVRTQGRQPGCLRCCRLAHFCECPPIEPEEEEPRTTPESAMSLIRPVVSFGGTLVLDSLSSWIAPFVGLQRLWTIDSVVSKSMYQDLVEELHVIPDTLACQALSLIPNNWLEKPDGSPTFLGKRKTDFIKMFACHRQIIFPLQFYVRRAFTCACVLFFALWFGQYMLFYWLNCKMFIPYLRREILKVRKSQLIMPFLEDVIEFDAMKPGWKKNLLAPFAMVGRKLSFTSPGWLLFWRKFDELSITVEYMEAPWYFWPLVLSVLWGFLILAYQLFRRSHGMQRRYNEIVELARSNRDFQRSVYDQIRRAPSEYNEHFPTAVGLVGCVVTGIFIWNQMRPRHESFRERENRHPWNDWFGSFTRRSPARYDEMLNHSEQELLASIQKCMVRVSARAPDGSIRNTQGYYLHTGYLAIPAHFMRKDTTVPDDWYEYLDFDLICNGYRHKVRAYSESVGAMPGLDAVIIYVPKAPKLKRPGVSYLSTSIGTGSHKSWLLHYTKEEDYIKEPLNATYVPKIDTGLMYVDNGLEYQSSLTTNGFCFSPIVSAHSKGCILGFHISGLPSTLTKRRGFAQCILAEDYSTPEKCDALFPTKFGRITMPHAGVIEDERFGQKYIKGPGPHPASEVMEQLAPFPSVQVLGHDLDLPKYKSAVHKSMISESLEHHSGVPCKWKAPDMSQPWRHHNRALGIISEHTSEVNPVDLEWSVNDYLNQISDVLSDWVRDYPQFCRPLVGDEIVNGNPEAMFMTQLKMDTSVGPPMMGSKKNSGLFIEKDPLPSGLKQYGFTPELREQFSKMMACYEKGEKYGALLKSCLKDETRPVEKDKVRLFYILEITLTLGVRKYLLPVIEFLHRHPLESECAVGINCASPEWEKMVKHVMRHSPDEVCIDSDFSDYDLRRSQDVMIANMQVWLEIAKRMGYPEKDLHIMTMMFDDLRNPTVNWNGSILSIFFWISGVTGTVEGGNGEGSLHRRNSFHRALRLIRGLTPEEIRARNIRYRDVEGLMGYGDDQIGAPAPKWRDCVNFTVLSQYFDSIGMKITDATKSSNPSDFKSLKEIDFLKRSHTYIDELDAHVGALEQDSIWKMGHMDMRSTSSTEEDRCISSMQSMLCEAFLHGREFYDRVQTTLRNVCEDTHLNFPQLCETFDERVEVWREKYQAQS